MNFFIMQLALAGKHTKRICRKPTRGFRLNYFYVISGVKKVSARSFRSGFLIILLDAEFMQNEIRIVAFDSFPLEHKKKSILNRRGILETFPGVGNEKDRGSKRDV